MGKKIVVFGAAGHTGRQIVAQALDKGYLVTAFVRSPDRLKLKHESLSIVKGDVLNRDDVEKAVAGQDAVLSALGVKPFAAPVCAPGVMNMIAAMRKGSVPRLVVESAYGTGNSNCGIYGALLNFMLRSIMRDKVEMESILKECEVDFVAVRPTILTNGPFTGSYKTGADLRISGFKKISRADVADLMLRALVEDEYLNRFPTITY